MIDIKEIPLAMNTKEFWKTKEICHLATKLGLIIIVDDNSGLFILSSVPPVEGSLDDIEKYLNRLWGLKAFL